MPRYVLAMQALEGKVAIITGAAGGIGSATARLFAREGAKIVLNDAGVDASGTGGSAEPIEALTAELRATGAEVISSTHSVATAAGAEAIVGLCVAQFGRVDALINNAGIARDASLLKLNAADFDAVLDVNLKGTWWCMQAALAVMKRQGSGNIVNTASTAGLLGNFGQASSTAAAAGVYGLTRTASIEMQRFGIRVNAVAPLAKTRQTEHLPMFEKVDSMRAEHVAPVHLFLASELSGDTTGVMISVAGGRLCVTKLVESAGQFKDSQEGVWTATEIAEHFPAIRKA
jgi:NAD(P)-dependent dehydrogenase (short-subunit alcohol dehydrogenase family)